MPPGPLGPLGGGIGGGPLMPPDMGGPMPGIGPIGGMHVGPGHPFFSDRMRHPDLAPGAPGFRGGGHPGGARWDPISEWLRGSCIGVGAGWGEGGEGGVQARLHEGGIMMGA